MNGALLGTTAVLVFHVLSPTAVAGPPSPPLPWGAQGHQMAARVAAESLPRAVPSFFRTAERQLAYLNPEPDRWRERSLREMDQAFSYDHYVDLENLPEGALEQPDRWAYLRSLLEAGLERPEAAAGFLPFRIVELYQRLVTEWRLWRAETDPAQQGWIEQRIINDAGVLGHYVTDASNPHHSTIHFNGWVAQDAYGNDVANPEGFTDSDDFHWRFETLFVEAHVGIQDVRDRLPDEVRSVAGDARDGVMELISNSNEHVVELYRLEKEVGFERDGEADPAAVDFAARRLAYGAQWLRTLWWSAWVESAQPAP